MTHISVAPQTPPNKHNRCGQAPPLLPPTDSILLAPDAYNPTSLALVRSKPAIVLHMLEHRIGRKPLRDVLRQVACPGSDEVAGGAAATAAGGVNCGPPSKDEVRRGISHWIEWVGSLLCVAWAHTLVTHPYTGRRPLHGRGRRGRLGHGPQGGRRRRRRGGWLRAGGGGRAAAGVADHCLPPALPQDERAR